MRELIDYLGDLTVTQGPAAGEPFDVLPWQARFVRGAFAPDVVESALSVGRGNGKTTLLAGVAAATVDGPLAKPRAETLIVAASFEQGLILFAHALAFLGDLPRDRYRVLDNDQRALIEDRATGAKLRVLASDPRRMHGAAPGLTLCDEPAQWPPGQGERAIAALRTAAGKIEGARIVLLGTRSDRAAHWFSRSLDGGADFGMSFAAKANDPPFQRRTWRRANPSLDAFPQLEAAIRAEAAKAKRDESLLASFESLRLNKGVSDTPTNLLLDATTWAGIEGEAAASGPCYWGVDLGGSAAQSAVAGYWPDTGRLDVLAAFPAEPDLRIRGVRDAVDSLYLDCERRGELIVLGQRTVPVARLLAEARARFGRPVMVAADRWREAELLDALDELGLRVRHEPRGQGYRDGGEDVREFRRACLDGRVTPSVSLLARSAMAEARTVSDPAGNSKLAKSSEGGRRQSARDDAAAAAILAVSVGVRHPPPKPRTFRSRVVGG